MFVIGLHGSFGGGVQDAAACLFEDGQLIYAVEEERLNKIKHSEGKMPLLAINEILTKHKLTIQDIAYITCCGKTWGNNFKDQLQNFFLHHFQYCPPLKFFLHHHAHAASTYFYAPFDEALVFSMDNSGDGIASQIMKGKGNKLSLIKNWNKPNSFGTFYSCFTQLVGFKRDAGEYKLMGLAAYGNPLKYNLELILYNDEVGNYYFNDKYVIKINNTTPFPNKQIPIYNKQLLRHLNLKPTDLLDFQVRADIAASAQYQLEKVILKWTSYWIKKYNIYKICLSGGVAMNCVMTAKLQQLLGAKNVYINNFPGDQGICIGAVILSLYNNSNNKIKLNLQPYLGSAISSKATKAKIELYNLQYTKLPNIYEKTVDLILQGKIVAWCNGRAEFGARALGNRSILANPSVKGMKEKINAKIKFRESFRPFCPSVLEEDFHELFDSNDNQFPFMNTVVQCKPICKKLFPEIVHIDNTARVQTVNKTQNPKFYRLLKELKKKNQYGIVINTSLNVRNQPMAYDINDVLTAYFTSGIDAAFINDFILEK